MLNIFKYSIYPLVLIGSCLAFSALLQTELPVGIALLIVSACNIITVAVLELLLPYDQSWVWWGHRQTINDVLHGLATSELGPRLAAVGLASVVVSAMSLVAEATGGGLWPNSWHFAGQLLLAIVLVDFTEWGKHWLYHNVGVFWPIHALHHDMDRLNVSKSMRLHFFEGAIRYVGITAVLTILGAPAEILLWYTALLTFNGSLNHSNIDIRLPNFVNYCMQTSDLHRLHHAMDPELGRCNLASMSTLPDHLFGTYRSPAKHSHGPLGIHNSPVPSNWFQQLLVPLRWSALDARATSNLADVNASPANLEAISKFRGI